MRRNEPSGSNYQTVSLFELSQFVSPNRMTGSDCDLTHEYDIIWIKDKLAVGSRRILSTPLPVFSTCTAVGNVARGQPTEFKKIARYYWKVL